MALSLFNILRFPLLMLPNLITMLVQVGGASGRGLQSFFHTSLFYYIFLVYSNHKKCDLHVTLFFVVSVCSVCVQVNVSVKRLREFLEGEELDPDNTDWREEPAEGEHLVIL